MRRLAAIGALGVVALLPRLSAAAAKEALTILQDSCLKCHGAALQLGKLDLRTRDSALRGGVHGPALVPGKAEESRLYRHVMGIEKPQMPMDAKLPAEQVATLKQWIEGGAAWGSGVPTSAGGDAAKSLSSLENATIPEDARKWWAFQRPSRPPVPRTAASHPIDAFLLVRMQERGIQPAPEADRRTLVRRAYLDLIGLPPTPTEVNNFVNDTGTGAWDRLIDKLLASPHYGERWARHWLDVARYADSNGYEHDFDRPNAWRYRDYVIGAFNQDKPYDVFLHEQIAGDELDTVTNETLIATGFLRNYAKVGFREKDNPQFRYEYLDDMIATLGRGVLGMTVQCARCHNHKFDPIPQRDYYRMQASLFGYVEVDHPLTPQEQSEAYKKAIAEIEARTRPLKDKIRELEQPYRQRLLPAKYQKFPENVQKAIATPEDQRTPGQVLLANQIIRTVSVSAGEIERIMTPADLSARNTLQEEIRAIEKRRPKPIPVAMGITDGDYRFAPDGPGDEPAPGKGVKREAMEGSFLHAGTGHYEAPPSYFLISGDTESRGSQMKPGFLTVATYGNPPVELPPANGHTSGRRRALAQWLTSAENPLTARVMVNRIWHHHFGRGIVATLDNFGKMGEKPSHPELLDWLALEFMQRGWSIKQMHRLIMTSAAYRRASQFESTEYAAKDPDNINLWRFRLQRLDAEIVRDAILAVSGGLNREMFGKAVFPTLQPEILASMDKGIWLREEDGPKVWRRSIYVYRKRGLPFPLFEVFDLPDQNISCGRRNVSTVPTQALTLLNNAFILRQARLFADRVREAAPDDMARQAELAFEIALGRIPTADERGALAGRSIEDVAHVLFNLNEFVYIR